MRIGSLLMPADPWDETVAHARRLESMGFAHLWVYDHLNWQRYRARPWYSAVPWLTGVAAATRTIRLGTMVANPNIRHPVTFAKEAVSLDHVSHGRFVAGIGTGGTGSDAIVLGTSPMSPGRRVDRFAEFLEVFDGALMGRIGSYKGDYYRVNDIAVHPASVQKPRLPIAVAAGGARTLDLAARYGEAWITWGDTTSADLTPEGTERLVRNQAAILLERCEAAGRDPVSIDRIYMIGNTEEKPLTSIERFVDFVGRYREIGFTDIVFHHPRTDDPVFNEPLSIVEAIADYLPRL